MPCFNYISEDVLLFNHLADGSIHLTLRFGGNIVHLGAHGKSWQNKHARWK